MTLEGIQVGDFRTRVQIQSRVMVRSSDGGYTPVWAAVRSVWAAFIPLDNPTRPARNTWSSEGKEVQFAGQNRSTQKHVIFIRAQPETIQTTWRLTTGGRVLNISEALLISNVKKMVRIIAIENISQPENAAASGDAMTITKTSYSWGEIDFTTTQNIVVNIPSGKYFAPKAISGFVSTLVGTVLTEPIINLGIPANHTKYLSGKTFTQLSAALSNQEFTTMLADNGETSLWIEIATGGTVSGGGSYRGLLYVSGDLIGA